MMMRPILFSAPMVRAILAGAKTQTRRVVKGAPLDWAPIGPEVYSPTVVDRRGEEQPGPDAYGAGNEDGSDWIRCPYGRPGDRLWVREAWAQNQGVVGGYLYAADHGRACQVERIDLRAGTALDRMDRWRPSIHMPRSASRITLEVTGVRVERLQDISQADAIAEGIDAAAAGYWRLYGRNTNGDMDRSPRVAYRSLWASINGPGSWDANPWVWVVQFRRVEVA